MKTERKCSILIFSFLLVQFTIQAQIKNYNIDLETGVISTESNNQNYCPGKFNLKSNNYLKEKLINSGNFIDSIEIVKEDGSKEKQIYNYNPNENSYSELYKKWENNWINDWLYTFKDDSVGNIIYRSRSNWEGDNWENYWRYVYEYDNHNNNTSETFEIWNSNTWMPSKHKSYIYNEYDQIIQTLDEISNGNAWHPIRNAQYSYDEYGNRNFWLTQNYIGNTWVNERRTNAEFNQNGNRLLYQVEIGSDSAQWTFEKREVNSYNEDGKIITSFNDIWENGQWINQNSYQYSYLSNSNVEQEVMKLYLEGTLLSYTTTINKLDVFGNVDSSYFKFWDGEQWVDSEKGTYLRDINGNITLYLLETNNQGNWESLYREQYTYINNKLVGVTYENSQQGSWSLKNGLFSIDDSLGNVHNIIGAEIHIFYATTTDIYNDNYLANSFVLWQNYPNPFNPATTISYSLPETSHIKLSVFDLLGQEITTLVNEEKPAGKYEVNFNASNLSSGIYLYRLQAGSSTETKKLVLIK